ncbi:hypothetical protein CEXT_270841 [Caerostris extrusa]|uniref:Uncharacterized protein n=1 Tax=Caerostris extrusa TaxID=172846 RepID=A0AAV4T951_CAEEX|nr:hypothetical protein CEXT_270841 [Caerostris extrusa]
MHVKVSKALKLKNHILNKLAGGNLPQSRHILLLLVETRLKVIFRIKGNEMEPLASNLLSFHFSFADYPGRFLNPPRKVIEWLKTYLEVKSETLPIFVSFSLGHHHSKYGFISIPFY